MVASFLKPGDCRVKMFSIEGMDLTGFVHCVRVYETICKPYRTAEITLIDNDNIIDNMYIRPMMMCYLEFDSPPNDRVYRAWELAILNLAGHPSPTTVKTQIYTLDLIGMSYYNDKTNIVQETSSNEPGTALIQRIWNKYLAKQDATIEIKKQSDGAPGTQEDPYNIQHKKPFAAIDEIRKLLKFGGQSSPTVFFRDREKDNLVPIKDLLDNPDPLYDFIQKETWGADFLDKDIYKSIIAADADIDKNYMGEILSGFGSGKDTAKAGVQGQAVIDLFTGVMSHFKQAQQLGSAVGSVLNTIAGGLGGSPNGEATNSNRWPDAIAPWSKVMQEQSFTAEVKNNTQLKIKVPLQTGIELTVGKGFTVKLLPPVGDLLNFNIHTYSLNGDWLVKDLCHELYTDKRDVKGTTTAQGVRKL